MWRNLLYAVLGGLLVVLAMTLNGERKEHVENINVKKEVAAAKEKRQEIINNEVIHQFKMKQRGLLK